MTRTISLIIATVGTALLFAVPAWGDNWGADQAQQSQLAQPDPMIEDGFAQAIATKKAQSSVSGERARSEALNRMYGLGEYANSIDSRERALVEKSQTTTQQPVVGFDARSDGMNRLYGLGKYEAPVVGDDRFRIDQSNVPEPITVSSSGREIEWPQVGIGFGVGLVLLLGLGLTLKATHTRPFAH
jgi:hypothetical protein